MSLCPWTLCHTSFDIPRPRVAGLPRVTRAHICFSWGQSGLKSLGMQSPGAWAFKDSSLPHLAADLASAPSLLVFTSALELVTVP